MIIPDPWFNKATEADSRFVAGECDFVELWQLENGDVVEHTDTLKADEVEDWAREKGNHYRRPSNSVGGLRILVGTTRGQHARDLQGWPLSEKMAKVVFHELRLLTTLFQACITGNRVLVVCKSHLSTEGLLTWVMRQLCHAAALSYCAHTNIVRGVVFTDQKNRQDFISHLIELKTYACHPMLVPLVILTHEMERLIDERREDNNETLKLEQKIGLRRDWTTDEDFLKSTDSAMRWTLESLAMITNHKADTDMVANSFMAAIFNSINLVNEQIPLIQDKASQERMKRQSLDLEYRIEYLSQSNTSITASFGALQKRVEAQMSGLYTLLGQRDSKLNLAMAYDSRRLASASKRDSSSMKTIAVLTIVFLPGTFIATVFGMPMVDYSPSQFWIYLAISIPLTIVVMTFWAAWMLWINQQNEKEDAKAQEHLFLPSYEQEEKLSNEQASLFAKIKRLC